MKDVVLTPYKLLRPREFSYVTVTSRNGGKISLAINNTDKTFIVSSSYINFRCADTNVLLPEFLYLLLSRSEFDRYARFNSWGSARETFDWEELCRIKIALRKPFRLFGGEGFSFSSLSIHNPATHLGYTEC